MYVTRDEGYFILCIRTLLTVAVAKDIISLLVVFDDGYILVVTLRYILMIAISFIFLVRW